MTQKAPERIWVEDERHVGGICHVYYETDPAHQYYATEYVHIDHALSLVAVAYDEAASQVNQLSHTATVTGNFTQAATLANMAEDIRARTDTDAQAALERVKQASFKAGISKAMGILMDSDTLEEAKAALSEITEDQSNE